MVPPAVILLRCIRFVCFRPVVKPASYRNFRQAPSRSHPAYPYFTAFDLYSLFPQAGFTVGELFFSLKKHGSSPLLHPLCLSLRFSDISLFNSSAQRTGAEQKTS